MNSKRGKTDMVMVITIIIFSMFVFWYFAVLIHDRVTGENIEEINAESERRARATVLE